MGEDLRDTGDNIVVGGANRWAYGSFVNWEFFPEGWIDQPQGPILVYFKETQSIRERDGMLGLGQSANSEEEHQKDDDVRRAKRRRRRRRRRAECGRGCAKL